FDRVVLSEEALERFHDQHSRELVRWDESFRSRARIFDLQPGMGGYMPSTTGHMVENGDAPSTPVSFTYYTDSTRRPEMLYRGNCRLRGAGIEPHAIGQSRLRDALKYAGLSSYFCLYSLLRRTLGLGVRDNHLPYAPAN